MTEIIADRVRDTSTTTGTGPFTVTGTPPTRYRTFSAVCSVNDTFPGWIANRSQNEWLAGELLYSAANEVTVESITAGSNGTSAVSFTAGIKDIVLDFGAGFLTTRPSIKLSANLLFYISNTGSNTTGDGSIGSPYATIQYAYGIGANIYDFAGFHFTLKAIGSGTLAGLGTGLGTPSLLRCSQFALIGNNVDPTQLTLTRNTAPGIGTACISIFGFDQIWVSGFTFSDNCTAIDAVNSIVFLGEPTSTEPSKCIYKPTASVATLIGAIYDQSLDVSTVDYTGHTTQRYFWEVDQAPAGGNVFLYGPDFTFVGTPAFTAFIFGQFNALLYTQGAFGNGGTATGKLYQLFGADLIASGETALLGNAAGDLYMGARFISLGTGTVFTSNYVEQINASSATFSALPANPKLGMMFTITDSTTAVWGAVIAGLGGNTVLGWFNGANWTVVGK